MTPRIDDRNRFPRATHRRRPGVERLEGRLLLAASILESPIPSPDTGPSGIAAVPGGDVWFLETSTPTIASIDPTTHAITEYPLVGNIIGGTSLTAGPDGNLWFTGSALGPVGDVGNPAIGMFNPTTHTTQAFTFGTLYYPSLGGITTGPDGNLWFPESIGGQLALGSINPTTHVISRFLAPTGSGNPRLQIPYSGGITTGADGNLSFSVETALFPSPSDGIGSFNPTTYQFTETPLPTPGGQPVGITAGPDGNLWFVESSGNKVGSINPTTHAIAEYPLPGLYSNPSSITTGADGNLWFTENSLNQVGSINPTSHVITEYRLPSPVGLSNTITTGPGGTLWFTETYANQIGEIRFAPATITTVFPSANPSPLNSPLGLIVTVVPVAGGPNPTGLVAAYDGRLFLGTAPLGANGQAILATTVLGGGFHSIQAVYLGDANHAYSLAKVLNEFIAPPDGPRVVSIAPAAPGHGPAGLVVRFTEGLYRPYAERLSNYRLNGPRNRSIALRAAVYDPATDSVTLIPRAPLKPRQALTLRIIGVGPTGVADTDGRLLDGGSTGQPGGNFQGGVTPPPPAPKPRGPRPSSHRHASARHR